jgi:hypothetical protein
LCRPLLINNEGERDPRLLLIAISRNFYRLAPNLRKFQIKEIIKMFIF